jgi:hypothetical protein
MQSFETLMLHTDDMCKVIFLSKLFAKNVENQGYWCATECIRLQLTEMTDYVDRKDLCNELIRSFQDRMRLSNSSIVDEDRRVTPFHPQFKRSICDRRWFRNVTVEVLHICI